MIRLALALALVATPAIAKDVTSQKIWNAETIERGKVYDKVTIMNFERTAPEHWKVDLYCTRTNVRTDKEIMRSAKGRAYRSEGVIFGEGGKLGKFIIGPRWDIVFPDASPCGSGKTDLTKRQ